MIAIAARCAAASASTTKAVIEMARAPCPHPHALRPKKTERAVTARVLHIEEVGAWPAPGRR